MTPRKIKRVLLKISGEAFRGSERYGIDADAVHAMAQARHVGKLVLTMGERATTPIASCSQRHVERLTSVATFAMSLRTTTKWRSAMTR